MALLEKGIAKNLVDMDTKEEKVGGWKEYY